MKKRTPISKIMTKNPISVNLTNNISDVVQIFQERNIRHIPVVSGSKLIGMVSKTDIERISYVTNAEGEKVRTAVNDMLSLDQVMTRQLDTIQAEDQIRDAAELFARGQYNALPVLEGEKLAGIVTTTDVINYLLEQY